MAKFGIVSPRVTLGMCRPCLPRCSPPLLLILSAIPCLHTQTFPCKLVDFMVPRGTCRFPLISPAPDDFDCRHTVDVRPRWCKKCLSLVRWKCICQLKMFRHLELTLGGGVSDSHPETPTTHWVYLHSGFL